MWQHCNMGGGAIPPPFYFLPHELMTSNKKSPEECLCCLLEKCGKKRNPKNKEQGMYDAIQEILEIMDMPWPEQWQKQEKIMEAQEEFYDRIWYNRHMCYSHKDGSKCLGKNEKMGCKAAAKKRKQYPDIGEHDDFEYGMLNGKLSALRWVMGDEWDMLDT